MDEKDFEILKILDKNCRTSYSNIAKKLDLTIRVVSKRVKKLVEENIIRYFTIQFNYNLLSYRHYIGSINPPKDITLCNFIKEIQLIPEIYRIWVLLDGSLIFSFFCQNARHLEEIINQIVKLGAKMNNYIETRTHLTPDIPFSLNDWRIIFFLLKNSRASKLDIADALDISEKTVMRRLNRMINMKIVQFIPEINLEAFYGMISGIISLETNGPSKEMYLKVKNDKTIKFWRNTGGVTPSIVLFVYGRNISEIYNMYIKLKNNNDIKNSSLSFVVKDWENSTFLEDLILEKIQQG